MIKTLSLMIVIATLALPAVASDNFTLYLVRHAEKQLDSKNPSLTQCGRERARQLATLLSTANIKSIYSTGYQRTMSTAAPLSKTLNIPIKNYNPRQLEQVSLQLKQNKQNALIVGHSNTTPQLAHILSQLSIEPMSEKNYQVLYQIHFAGKQVSLTKLLQPHTCKL